MKTKISIFLAVLIIALTACLENEIEIKSTDDMNFRENVEFAAPLGTVRMPLARIIQEQMLDEYKDNFFYLPNCEVCGRALNENAVRCPTPSCGAPRTLHFRYDLSHEFEWGDVDIEDFDFKRQLNFNPNYEALPEFPELPINIPPPANFLLPFEGYREFTVKMPAIVKEDPQSYFTEVLLSEGDMKLIIDIKGEGFVVEEYRIKLTFNNLSKDGTIFSHTFTHQNSKEYEEFLEGYVLTATRAETEKTSYTQEEAKAEIVFSEGEARVDYMVKFSPIGPVIPMGAFTIEAYFKDLDFYEVTGYFGQIEVNDFAPNPENEPIVENGLVSFFEELDGIEGDFGVHNAKIEVFATNNIVMPAVLHQAEIYFVNRNHNWKVRPDSDDYFYKLSNSLYVESAQLVDGVIVPGANNDEFINEKALLDRDYSIVLLRFHGMNNQDNHPLLNPDFDDNQNYLKKDDLAKLDVTLTMPFDFILTQYTNKFVLDNFHYRDLLNDDEDLSKSIETLFLYLNIKENRQPFSGTIGIFAIHDENDDPGIKIAEVEILGVNKITIPVSQAILSELWAADVRHLHFIPDITIKGDGKITKDSTLDISVGIEFKSNLPISIF